MKIRLKITSPNGRNQKLDLGQPEVAIGRNPASLVAFDDIAGKGVSWDHAAIRVEGNTISIADVGSSNGTLVNDKMLNPRQPVPLKVRDRIQLGHTGPKIVLLAFDPSAPAPENPKAIADPAPAATAARNRSRRLIGGGAAAFALVAILGIVVFGGRRGVNPNQGDTPTNGGTNAPLAEIKAPPFAGRVVKGKNSPPGTLLQWPGGSAAWSPLGDGGIVHFKQMLLALPGFRCGVHLNSGVGITAMSNLPIFDPPSPGEFYPQVVETSWIQLEPEAGFDAALVFDRGRLHFFNGKSSGPVRIKLFLRNSEWEIGLKGSKSQVAVEYSFLPLVASKLGEPLKARSEAMLGFITEGPVVLKRKDETFDLSDRSILFEKGDPQKIYGPEVIEEWPSWRNPNFGQSKKEAVLDAVIALKEWADALEKSEDVQGTLLERCAKEKAPNRKLIDYLILGSFGEPGITGKKAIEELCNVIESDKESVKIRESALLAMQTWLNRSSRHIPFVLSATVAMNRYTKAEAERILRLSIDMNPEDTNNSALFQGWLADLESPKPAIRFLAYRLLRNVLGEKGPGIPKSYDPNKKPEEPDQVKALAEWHKLLPPNWLPPMPASP